MSGHSDEVNGVAFHRTKPLLATVSDDRDAVVWDVVRGKEGKPTLAGD